MLVTDPAQRASLAEIMNHPWITKGFSGAPDNYLPQRRPLQLPLDPKVLQKMDGFDFGAADIIEAQLTKVLQSEEYQQAVFKHERRSAMPTPEIERKRGVFDFYKRRSSTTSRDTLSGGLSSEAVAMGVDPLNAFSPLISIYFLAKEKIEREGRETNPGALSIPTVTEEKTLQVPDLQAPAAAYTNAATYEMAGEKPTGGRNRPRARTHGEDEVLDDVQNLSINNRTMPPSPAIVLPPQDQTPAKKDSVAGLLRRFSTRRHREPEKPAPVTSSAQTEAFSTPRKSFSMRRPSNRDTTAAGELRPEETGNPEYLTPPAATEAGTRRVGLGRSTSVATAEQRRRIGRRGVSEGSSALPLMTPQTSRPGQAGDQHGAGDAASDIEPSVTRSAQPASRTKSVGHARRNSVQTRRARRVNMGTADVPEETDADMQDSVDVANVGGGTGSPTGMKPVFLKGLFSVSTTSSKPLTVIRGDIIRVLKQLGVEYREIKGGFSCRHSPSIDLKKGNEESERRGSQSASAAQKRRISFGNFRSGTNNERDEARMPATPTQSSRFRRAPDHSFTNSESSDEDSEGAAGNMSRNTRKSSTGHRRAPGETSTHVQSDLGESMALKFEIFVVKVPLLSLHGIQFKKVDGGTWQYKNMAQTILNDLRL